jgi:hypothetical protein
LGDVGDAQALLQELGDVTQYGARIRLALFHAVSGDSEAGTESLDKAIEQRDPRVIIYLWLSLGKVSSATVLHSSRARAA